MQTPLESTVSPSAVLALTLRHDGASDNQIVSTISKVTGRIAQLGDLTFGDACTILAMLGLDVPSITTKSWDRACREIERHRDECVHILCVDDPTYPNVLKIIPAAPPLLFVRGALNTLVALPGVAIVGTRKATRNGELIASRIAGFLAQHNWVIVSGLALGIDAAAHRGTIDARGRTIAVLAHGLHKASPKKNAPLAQQILEEGGAWVSEHALGVEPRRHYFVPRNRIQIGLSAGSIIVESDVPSGTMTQAQYCVGQKRPLFAVVPKDRENTLGLVCAGTKVAVRELGAIPLRGRDDYDELLAVLESSREALRDV